MSKPLVVVESPTKVRTIKKYLGGQYNVAATVGHIKDLPPREMGIDIEKGFKPKYRIIKGKQKVVSQLKKSAGNAEDVYLAPDPDREGEAIAWHASEVLKKKGRRFHRVLFHELTKRAITESMARPEELNHHKYEAQQARRILDRLVGYEVSPLLWRKVKGGLSAGRVQSVAVRIICERERAIQAFEPEEYWSITAHLASRNPPPFTAKLVRKGTEKIKIGNAAGAREILEALEGQPFVVRKINKRTTKRNPPPPFTTSKLQQEAIRKLRFSARKTMTVAQQLYEGIDLGPGEPVGLITYMRTDSTRIAQEAAHQALDMIRQRFGADYAPDKPRFFKNRKKVQDAHEAIRPTDVSLSPEQLATHLNKDQLALYTLIWKRFSASQMAQALIDRCTVTINAGDYTFSATGSTIKFPGFMKLYQSADDQQAAAKEKSATQLPELTEGQTLDLHKLDPKQHFTQPPPRFSEASLVKELEENGIGRPSTYAAILSTIRDKGYVELNRGYFHPTELGFIVIELIVETFPEIFSVEFTARMEDSLDRIETAQSEAGRVLADFYGPFSNKLASATESMRSMKRDGLSTGLTCPACGKHELRIKMGRNGHFLGCSGYPECTYTRNYSRSEKGVIEPIEPAPEEVVDKTCGQCGLPMVSKQGRYGNFLACSGYPQCKHTESLNGDQPQRRTGVACPREGCDGELVERKSRRGKIFYGCSRYPKCDFALWDKPVPEPCPQCGAPFLTEKTTKRDGTVYVCHNRQCRYRRPADEKPAA